MHWPFTMMVHPSGLFNVIGHYICQLYGLLVKSNTVIIQRVILLGSQLLGQWAEHRLHCCVLVSA